MIRVTATDLESGETETVEITDNYVLITAGSAYRANLTVHNNGTHVLTVKDVKPPVREQS